MKKLLVLLLFNSIILSTWAFDTYDPTSGQLTIPSVAVNNITYSNVVVKVGKVISIGDSEVIGPIDSYDTKTGLLSIPSVNVGSTTYNNVKITVGQILSIGSSKFNTYSIPTDISKITYPDSYLTPTSNSNDFNLDPCNLNLSVATYPQSWIGQYALPPVSGAPMKSQIQLGMYMKDIMLSNNPNFVLQGSPDAPNGCFNGSLQSEFLKSITKLKKLGAKYVYVPQWHWVSKKSDGTWYVVRAEDSFGPLTDADLTYFVKTAHSLGLKVIMKNQIQAFEDSPQSGYAYVPTANMQNYQNWFDAYSSFMSERAIFFQSIGIDIWELGCDVCLYLDSGDNSPQTIDFFAKNYLSIYNAVKNTFKGKFGLYGGPILNSSYATNLLNAIDYIFIGLYSNATNGGNLSVSSYKQGFLNSYMVNSINLYDTFNKTLIFETSMQSRSDALSNPGYMEETQCTASIGALNGSNSTCIQKQALIDFSLQAIVYEALLESLNNLNFKSNAILATGDYWETDSLTPETAFPNLAGSPRNKPAEGILKVWFNK